jgi:hypothetical protein
MQGHNDTGGIIGIPATVITWLSFINVLKLTPIFQFLVTVLSLLWLVIQISSWASKKYKEVKSKYAKK